jgi:hypothetical protein
VWDYTVKNYTGSKVKKEGIKLRRSRMKKEGIKLRRSRMAGNLGMSQYRRKGLYRRKDIVK